ncbi:6-phosphofructokinase [Candidatus Omnitrophota bacterium]
MKKKERIAILTAGGDCPGLNAVIRAVTKKAILDYQMEVVGIEDGYDGLIHNRHKKLDILAASGILTLGGTILGTSNTANPYRYPLKKGKKVEFKDLSAQVIQNIKKLGLDALVCVGGDGTMRIADRLSNQGIPIVGIPKTIDNDIKGTDVTFGFDSAVSIATEGIDRIHTTAMSHHRAMIIEVMGRNAGWIALYSGVAGGGDILLLPEIPYDIKVIAERVKARHKKGKRFSIIVAAEGARPKKGSVVVKRRVADGSEPLRLGGIGFVLANQIEQTTEIESRTVMIGHLQRGGSPTAFDRILGTQLGAKAVDLIAEKRFGRMVAVQGIKIADVDLKVAASGTRLVPPGHALIETARSIGAIFGD